MGNDLQLSIFIAGVFTAVTLIGAIVGMYVLRRQKIRLRIAGDGSAVLNPSGGASAGLARRTFDQIDDRFVGLDDKENRSKLRMELIQAGFFSPQAPKIYLVARGLVTLGLPSIVYIVNQSFKFLPSGSNLIIVLATLIFFGYIIPDAYLKRRQRLLLDSYRVLFPDMLDLLVVCVDAGLSFNTALDRIGREFASRSYELSTNLAILGGEVRSGRAVTEALDNLSIRLNLDEVKSFSTLMKQSIELGTDVGGALRVYASEMREKRMTRAEEKANALPIKMLLPLGLFIFPTILIVVLTPPFIKVAAAFKHIGGH